MRPLWPFRPAGGSVLIGRFNRRSGAGSCKLNDQRHNTAVWTRLQLFSRPIKFVSAETTRSIDGLFQLSCFEWKIAARLRSGGSSLTIQPVAQPDGCNPAASDHVACLVPAPPGSVGRTQSLPLIPFTRNFVATCADRSTDQPELMAVDFRLPSAASLIKRLESCRLPLLSRSFAEAGFIATSFHAALPFRPD
jgi:hypothetical protein